MSKAEQSVVDLTEVTDAVERMVAQAQSCLSLLTSKSRILPAMNSVVGYPVVDALKKLEGSARHLRMDLIDGKCLFKAPSGAETGAQGETGGVAEKLKAAEALVNEINVTNKAIAINGLGPLPKVANLLIAVANALIAQSISEADVKPITVDNGYVASINAQFDLFEMYINDAEVGWGSTASDS